MTEEFLIPIDILGRFGIVALIGLLIGLERSMKDTAQPHAGIRDFVLFALAGGLLALLAERFDNAWLVVAGFVGVLAILLSGYWSDQKAGGSEAERGTTTEIAGLVTFLLGVTVIAAGPALAIAFTVVVLVVLSQKILIGRFKANVQRFELDAALKLLVITFIVLPFLPNTPLDHYLTLPMGTVSEFDATTRFISIDPVPGQRFAGGDRVAIYGEQGHALGSLTIETASSLSLSGKYEGSSPNLLEQGLPVRREIGVRALTVMASAITPLRLWIIVVLVSLISFIGYVLVKVLGSAAGSGLTGIVGGLASSTVTAMSFARRSLEAPALNGVFAVAIILASTVMFPRLLVQIAVVNQALMQRMAVPILVMAATGIVVAALYYRHYRRVAAPGGSLRLENPFSLSSALKFAGVFAIVLMVTQLAITYLGNAWLPVVSIVSGLTDADAIAFSLSAAERRGQISTDWAAFNLVLGAISNTFTKLLLIFALGDRGLFRKTLVAFLVIAGSGLVTVFLYYDLAAAYAGG